MQNKGNYLAHGFLQEMWFSKTKARNDFLIPKYLK